MTISKSYICTYVRHKNHHLQGGIFRKSLCDEIFCANTFLSVFISFDNLLDDSHSNGFSFVTKSKPAHARKVVSKFHRDLARQSESDDALVSLLEEPCSGELLELLCLPVELGQESLDSDFFDSRVEMKNSCETLAGKKISKEPLS